MRPFLRTIIACLSVQAAAYAAEPPVRKPNIVLILADDLGYGDVKCLGGARGRIATPNMDRLAGEGMVFTDAHSSSSVCTPTRYGILTGRYNWRSRLQSGVMQDHQPPLIEADRLTVAKLLQQQGYHTACIGKWHLGYRYQGVNHTPKSPERPEEWPPVGTTILEGPITRGFDQFHGFHHAGSMHSLVQDDRVIAKIKPVEMLPGLTRRATAYIDERAKSKQPFFLYLPLNAPHTPIVPSREWRGKSGLNGYGDYVMQVDATVGAVLAALDQAGVAGNTVVLFTSDNGCSPAAGVEKLEKLGHFPSARFRGYKADIWEGGHRIPFIVRWPGIIQPGTTCGQIVSQMDLMATCADILGSPLPENAGVDSVSLLPLLRGGGQPVRETLVHHSIKGIFAIREGKWKLVLCSGSGGWSKPPEVAQGEKRPSVQLYDLSADPGERKNLQASHPAIVKRLTAALEKLVADGRSTPGSAQKNDVPIDITKEGK